MNNKWLGAKHCFALGCVLFIFFSRCEAQNLVPNPGFEDLDTCLTYGFEAEGPYSWHGANLTPDYLQSCLGSDHVFGLPLNLFTYQEPYEGFSCAGMYTYHQNGQAENREWIIAPLLEPLVVGQTYYCSFQANAAFGGNAQYPPTWLANDKVGMLFTMEDRNWQYFDPIPEPPNYAHVVYPQILTDTVGWTLVSGSFVADSAYQYVMIGQFFRNAMTDTMHFAAPESVVPWYPRGYTLVDAVCVSPNPNGCETDLAVGNARGELVTIYPNPAHDALWVRNGVGAVARVYDAFGRSLWEGTITDDVWKLPVAHWARGSYVLHLESASEVKSFKFMLIE